MSPGYPCCCGDESPSSPSSPSISMGLGSPSSPSPESPSLASPSPWAVTQLTCCNINTPPSTAYLEVDGITNGTCGDCDTLGVLTLSNVDRTTHPEGHECDWTIQWFMSTGSLCGNTLDSTVSLTCCDRDEEPGEKYYDLWANVVIGLQAIRFAKTFQSNTDCTSFSESVPCVDSVFGSICNYGGGPALVYW